MIWSQQAKHEVACMEFNHIRKEQIQSHQNVFWSTSPAAHFTLWPVCPPHFHSGMHQISTEDGVNWSIGVRVVIDCARRKEPPVPAKMRLMVVGCGGPCWAPTGQQQAACHTMSMCMVPDDCRGDTDALGAKKVIELILAPSIL